MAKQHPQHARTFSRYVTARARTCGYNLADLEGRTKLAKDAGMAEVDVAALAEGKYEPPTDLLKPLAKALHTTQKELLRKAGILEPSKPRPALTPRAAAVELGIKSPVNVGIFEALVAALLAAEKRQP
jgi:transcriptional regulator with XRE-family HTH domain